MTKAHHLKARKSKTAAPPVPLNFLLACSQLDLDNFQMARLAEVADIRKQIHTLFDRLIDQTSAAALAQWFRTSDRQALKHAIENEESPIEWAQRIIQQQGRNEAEDDLIPLPKLNPGAAHLAAAMRYQERNIAEGKCQSCPEPLDRNSARYCTKHLALARHRAAHTAGVKAEPGSADYLYGEITESTHGRQPATLASLEMNREKKTRALLAELGIPPESAAVTKRAAKEALLERMPNSKAEAKSASELFLGLHTSDSLAKKALAELFAEGKIQRFGKGTSGEPFKYFTK